MEHMQERRRVTVTVSAAYGAGGSVVAPRLAERLGVGFLDRVTPSEVRDVVERTGRTYGGEGLADAERDRVPLNRFLAALGANAAYGLVSTELAEGFDEDLRRTGEAPIWELVREGGGVILGRAGEPAIGELVPALHVRLDGPHERKVQLAMRIDGIDQESAERNLREADRAREAYTRRLYGVDPTDPRRYHLVVDPTRLGIEATVETVHAAALAYGSVTTSA